MRRDLFIKIFLVLAITTMPVHASTDENLIKLKALSNFADQLKESIGQDVNTVEPIVGHPLFRLNPANEYWLTTKPFTLNGGGSVSQPP